MDRSPRNAKVAVIGGDARELVVIPELLKIGLKVRAVGFPRLPELDGAEICSDVGEAVSGADAIILPMPGTDGTGTIRASLDGRKLTLTEDVLCRIPSRVPIIVGVAGPFLSTAASKYRLRVREIAEEDELAILNSIPTAEGAIQIAMQELPITIHSSSAFVLGFGRIGHTLARMLKGIGAVVSVFVRQPRDLARAYEEGYRALPFDCLEALAGEAEIVFNTVPSLVLTREVLDRMSREALIVDLASGKGGTDFDYAEYLGIKAVLASGLPGKVAPLTAGRTLARVLPRIIAEELTAISKY